MKEAYKRRNNKSGSRHYTMQSAMEYLFSYSWLLLVIAIVLLALFSSGAFNVTLGNACLPQSGFLCSEMILNSSGFLKVNFGSVQPLQINSIWCLATSSPYQPNVIVTDIPLNSDQNTTLIFYCPIHSNALGTPLAARLWIGYTQNNQAGYETNFAVVFATSTTAAPFGSVLSAGGSECALLLAPSSGATLSEFLALNIPVYSGPSLSVSSSGSNVCNSISSQTTSVSVSGSRNNAGILSTTSTPISASISGSSNLLNFFFSNVGVSVSASGSNNLMTIYDGSASTISLSGSDNVITLIGASASSLVISGNNNQVILEGSSSIGSTSITGSNNIIRNS